MLKPRPLIPSPGGVTASLRGADTWGAAKSEIDKIREQSLNLE